MKWGVELLDAFDGEAAAYMHMHIYEGAIPRGE
jgi:hypothetical protein